MDDDGALSGEDSLGGATAERALNDVAFSIGFAMMVLLLVVVSSMTMFQNVAVNLPRAEPVSGEERPARKVPVIVVTMEADPGGGLAAVRVGDAPVDLAAPLEPRLEALFDEVLAGADEIVLRIDADGRLSHAAVSETVFRLNAAFVHLGGAARKVDVRYTARRDG